MGNMTQNMAMWDRIARAVIALVLIYLAVSGVVLGFLAVLAWVVAAIFLLTALVGFCPLYRLFKLNTLHR
jgi:hypothetical protein